MKSSKTKQKNYVFKSGTVEVSLVFYASGSTGLRIIDALGLDWRYNETKAGDWEWFTSEISLAEKRRCDAEGIHVFSARLANRYRESPANLMGRFLDGLGGDASARRALRSVPPPTVSVVFYHDCNEWPDFSYSFDPSVMKSIAALNAQFKIQYYNVTGR